MVGVFDALCWIQIVTKVGFMDWVDKLIDTYPWEHNK